MSLKLLGLSLVLFVLPWKMVEAETSFTFTYSDTTGLVGNGFLTTIDSGLGDGSLLAIGGYFTITAMTINSVNTGGNGDVPSTSPSYAYPAYIGQTFNLLPIGPSGNAADGYTATIAGFTHYYSAFDNLLYPANDEGSQIVMGGTMRPSPSYLDAAGLVFASTNYNPSTNAGELVAIAGNGASTYGVYSVAYDGYPVNEVSSGTFHLAAVPEPSAAALGGMAALAILLVTRRKRPNVGATLVLQIEPK